MRLLAAALGASACLAGCFPTPSPSEGVRREVGGEGTLPPEFDCEGSAASTWSPRPGQTYFIEARAIGPSCDDAVIALVVRTGEGAPLHAWASPAHYLFGFQDLKGETDMAAALAEFIDPARGGLSSTADLPDWPEGADHPPGEFPFLPDPDIDRLTYLSLRESALPVFCHVQGMESLACVAFDPAGPEMIGVQTFPG